MRVLFDSNVLLSAGLFPKGKVAEAVNYAASKHTIILTNTIIDEVKRVVENKFPESMTLFERFFASLKYEYGYVPEEAVRISQITIGDLKDKHVLVSATFTGADTLVTGDKHFFERKYEGIEILTPADFLKKY